MTPTDPSSDEKGRKHEARLALALDAGGLGLWELNLATLELTATDRCKANHGLPPERALSLEDDIIGAIDPEYRQPFREALETTLRDQTDFVMEVPNTWPDGSHHWLMIRGRVVDGAWLLGVTLDVTERRRLEETLREADRRKDDFLAVLGHELRNPLAPIVAAARFLELSGPPDPKLQRARETIIRQAKQITKIVDDLMDVARINTGKLGVQKSRTELGAILQQAVESCAPIVERRRHVLDLHVPPHPVALDADLTRMVQVVSNLITNAAKYMEEGGRIAVTASVDDGQAVIRVRDHGIGIAPEMIETIFQRFVQVGSTRYSAEGGLGLGLSLVKAIVDLHRGSVEVHSGGIGQGSEFVVRLPVAT